MAKSCANVDIQGGEITVTINPKMYPLPIVYQAADVFIDRAYVLLDGNPGKSIRVTLRPKKGRYDLEKLGLEFNNELLDYAAYFVRSQVNKELREAMVKQAFATASGGKELEEDRRRIDFGTKVPLIPDTSTKKGRRKPKDGMFENAGLADILAPWEKQKGAIKKEPRK